MVAAVDLHAGRGRARCREAPGQQRSRLGTGGDGRQTRREGLLETERGVVAGQAGCKPAGRVQKIGGDAVRVEAQLGPPSEATTTPRNVYLLVNGRFVRDRSLLHAVGMGYGEQLGPGRYPLCVLHVDLPPDAVDVNVHPQKMEVRFARPQSSWAISPDADLPQT